MRYTNGTGFRYWINGTRLSDVSITANATTTNSTQCSLFARSDGNSSVPDTTRAYAASFGLGLLGDTDAAAIYAVYRARHQRAYT